MSRLAFSKTVALALVTLLVASIVAFAKDSRIVRVTYQSQLSGNELSPGEYKVSWENSGSGVTVTFASGRKVVAKAEGKLVDSNERYESNAVIYDKVSDGTLVISQIRLAGTKQAIVFTP